MAKVKNTKLKIDCLMQWMDTLSSKKTKIETKQRPEQYVKIKGRR